LSSFPCWYAFLPFLRRCNISLSVIVPIDGCILFMHTHIHSVIHKHTYTTFADRSLV
jgi:hypothetical protein